MAPKSPRRPAALRTPRAPRAPKSASPKSTAQKPLATGDVEQFPKHAYRADMGEGLPPQAPPPTATDRGK